RVSSRLSSIDGLRRRWATEVEIWRHSQVSREIENRFAALLRWRIGRTKRRDHEQICRSLRRIECDARLRDDSGLDIVVTSHLYKVSLRSSPNRQSRVIRAADCVSLNGASPVGGELPPDCLRPRVVR